MSLVSLSLSVVVRHVDEGRCHHGDARALHEDVDTVVPVPASEDFSNRRSLLMNGVSLVFGMVVLQHCCCRNYISRCLCY